MRIGLPGPGFINRKRLILFALCLVIIIGLAVFLKDRYRTVKVKVTDTTPTTAQQATAQINYAQDKLKLQDYQSAVDGYFGASSNAYYIKDYKAAEQDLQNCIKNVPDAYVPYYIYSSLAEDAKNLNDKALEKSSLQTAIKKASAPNSGATPGTVKSLQNLLDSLK